MSRCNIEFACGGEWLCVEADRLDGCGDDIIAFKDGKIVAIVPKVGIRCAYLSDNDIPIYQQQN